MTIDELKQLKESEDNGYFQNLKPEIVEQLERSGLIQKLSGHTNKYTLSEDYHNLLNEGLRIGKRYMVVEVEQIVLALQGNALKVGELEVLLKDSFTRNQIKYLLIKLMDDDVLKVEGKIRGARYSLAGEFAELRGDALTSTVITNLRDKYE